MLTIVSLLVISLATVADACSSRARIPPPPPPPPPNAPPAPPVPPPIVKIVREREQVMSRQNCKQVAIATKNDASLASGVDMSAEQQQQYLDNKAQLTTANQCLNAEDFQYECEFTVYSEIALTVIYHPTGCGCAFTISVVKPRPRKPDVAGLMSVNAAYSTKVTRFAIVVYDVEADQVEVEIPQFAQMTLNENTTALIEKAVAADPNGDFTSITAGFAGTVKEFDKMPKQLDKNDPANKNFVPAIMFSIKQVYLTGAMFVVPCALEMHTAPNAYQSQCQPYRKDMPYAYSKRAALDYEEAEQTAPLAWFREFLLFPKQKGTQTCGNSGYEPKSRYITSFYNDPNCKATNGYLSFDREFVSTFDASNAVVGGWKWTRQFDQATTRVVFGVPQRFAPLTSVWCLGYSSIDWISQSGFEATQIPVTKGVCTALPTSGWVAANEVTKYKESHNSYPMNAGVQCLPASQQCASDVTLLAFQNENPRDFSKKEDSTLLTGPRRAFCSSNPQDGADRVVFDTLTFRGVAPGDALAKRNEDDSLHRKPHEFHMVYDAERDGLVHARHAPELVHAANQILRKRAETPLIVDPVAAPPHRDDFGLNTATGSVDANGLDGKSAGDHPIRKFPESYSAPLTLDPVQSADEKEPLVYNGTLVTGTPLKFCTKGDLGCSCRADVAADLKCDHPYECASNYCVRPECPAGAAGCKVAAENKCNDGLVVEDGYCVQKPSCTVGTIGCVCDVSAATPTCSEGACLDGRCLRATNDPCTVGSAGCPCTSEGKCNSGAQCDEYAGVCLFDSCAPGSAGCRCSKSGSPCGDGYTCSAKGSCIALSCTLGDAGCGCLANKKCNKRGFVCTELSRNGADNMCVGEQLCGIDQSKRCTDICGAGNVLTCGSCTYSQPLCRNMNVLFCNPDSPYYGVQECDSAASSIAVAAVAAIVACVALLF